MAENLNYDIPDSKCYGNKESNCATYGRLYNWATAMNLPASCNTSTCALQVGTKHRGICPSGWHIPSNDDWNVLMKFVNPNCNDNGGCDGAGTKLKASTGWNSYDGIPAGTDNYGFSALPSGNGSSDGSFTNVGYYGGWFSSSEDEYDASRAYLRYIHYSNEYVSSGGTDKSGLRSVRCLQD